MAAKMKRELPTLSLKHQNLGSFKIWFVFGKTEIWSASIYAILVRNEMTNRNNFMNIHCIILLQACDQSDLQTILRAT